MIRNVAQGKFWKIADRKGQRGFTIVELLIVIVVIAVLAAVTVVAYTGIKQNSNNATRGLQVQEWRKVMSLYKAQYGHYPPSTIDSGHFCLGEGFPTGGNGEKRCREYLRTDSMSYLEADNQQLMDELRKVATLPTRNPMPVQGWIVGPYINYWETGYAITQVFEGGSNDCPSYMEYTWDNGSGTVICYINVYD